MSYCNYVIYMPTIQQIKIGRTSNAQRRIKEIGRIAAKRGETTMQYMTSAAMKGIATITETELRRNWRMWSQDGSYEWLVGGALDFQRLCAQTRSIQKEVADLLGAAA